MDKDQDKRIVSSTGPTDEQLRAMGVPIPKRTDNSTVEKTDVKETPVETPAVETPVVEKTEVEKTEVKPEVKPVVEAPKELQALLDQMKMLQDKIASLEQPKKEEKVETKKEIARRAKLSREQAEAIALGGDEAVTIFNKVIEDIYADVIDQIVPKFSEEIGNQVGPVQRMMAEIEVVKRTQEFTSLYPDMKDNIDICHEVASKFVEQKKPFKSWEEFYKAVVDEAKPLVDSYKKRFGGTTQPEVKNTDKKELPLPKQTVRQVVKAEPEQTTMRQVIAAARGR
jgi:hypothetical protein